MTDFIPIDYRKMAKTCVNFRYDSFVASYGTAEKFLAWGAENYLEKLASWQQKFPSLCVHFLVAGKIVGQIEAQVHKSGKTGYVNLFYLTPEMRGQGLGRKLHDYVVVEFKKLGVEEVFLRVVRTNKRALKFYIKHGWEVVDEIDKRDADCSLLRFGLQA